MRTDPWLASMRRCRVCGEMRPRDRLYDGACLHHPINRRDCPRCHRQLTIADFYASSDGKLVTHRRICKDCTNRGPLRGVRGTPAQEAIAQRRDDLQIMIGGRETLEGAAERLGLSPASLERWCHRHAKDLLPKLTRPDLGHVHQGRIARSA